MCLAVPDVVPDVLSRRDYEGTRTNANEAIEAFPDLGAIKAVSKTDQSSSVSQTREQLDSSPQVISYQPCKPVKDFKHTGATFGTSATPVWEEIKAKVPSKVNACKERLGPALVQKV